MEQAAAGIRRLLRTQGLRCRDIGVTARDLSVYQPLVEAIFPRYQIPVFTSAMTDILDKPILTLVTAALDTVANGYRYDDVFRYLKTGLTDLPEEDRDLLENYVILWSIRGNMWLRDTEWTANPDGYGQEMTPERQQRLVEINRIRQKVRSTLLPLSDGLKDRPKARDKAEMLYIFAEESGVPQRLKETAEELLRQGQAQLAEEYSQLWRILCGVLDQMAEILGEIQAYYVQFPYWDTMLHTLNGFLCAAIGFSLLDILNRDERLAFKLSPVYLAVVAFCFSMTIGVLWEFFECFMDQMFLLDMQKDTIVHSIGSVMLDPAGGNTPVAIHDITDVIVVTADGAQHPLSLGGYLDIGILDTMKDLFVNFIGAVVFSFIGYFYVKNRGKGWFAKRFIPKVLPESGAKK